MSEKKTYNDVEAADLLHQVSNMYVSTKTLRDYGTGENYSSVEVHLLKAITDHPGITPSELADLSGRTRGAISQILKKAEEKGLIYRKTIPNLTGKVQLCVTEKGRELDRQHRIYDAVHFGQTMDLVRKEFAQDEIDTMLRVLQGWLEARRSVQKERMAEQRKASRRKRARKQESELKK